MIYGDRSRFPERFRKSQNRAGYGLIVSDTALMLLVSLDSATALLPSATISRRDWPDLSGAFAGSFSRRYGFMVIDAALVLLVSRASTT
jgi:hypothetical protein